jgi:hypothetical protein
VVGASCTLNISFKHTTGDYLDAENLLKPLEKSLMKLQRNSTTTIIGNTTMSAVITS